eukprot:TRINITY_DN24439_c0_g1_i1.p1 TRINITY_DN24439_c0_g1~~TRINITY_DN24439_c0_g1_i1.p1  ORF type:complete len:789 (-),score=148.57 TRINITY_DN24439_c0_g1_i1:50-2416(-)
MDRCQAPTISSFLQQVEENLSMLGPGSQEQRFGTASLRPAIGSVAATASSAQGTAAPKGASPVGERLVEAWMRSFQDGRSELEKALSALADHERETRDHLEEQTKVLASVVERDREARRQLDNVLNVLGSLEQRSRLLESATGIASDEADEQSSSALFASSSSACAPACNNLEKRLQMCGRVEAEKAFERRVMELLEPERVRTGKVIDALESRVSALEAERKRNKDREVSASDLGEVSARLSALMQNDMLRTEEMRRHDADIAATKSAIQRVLSKDVLRGEELRALGESVKDIGTRSTQIPRREEFSLLDYQKQQMHARDEELVLLYEEVRGMNERYAKLTNQNDVLHTRLEWLTDRIRGSPVGMPTLRHEQAPSFGGSSTTDDDFLALEEHVVKMLDAHRQQVQKAFHTMETRVENRFTEVLRIDSPGVARSIGNISNESWDGQLGDLTERVDRMEEALQTQRQWLRSEVRALADRGRDDTSLCLLDEPTSATSAKPSPKGSCERMNQSPSAGASTLLDLCNAGGSGQGFKITLQPPERSVPASSLAGGSPRREAIPEPRALRCQSPLRETSVVSAPSSPSRADPPRSALSSPLRADPPRSPMREGFVASAVSSPLRADAPRSPAAHEEAASEWAAEQAKFAWHAAEARSALAAAEVAGHGQRAAEAVPASALPPGDQDSNASERGDLYIDSIKRRSFGLGKGGNAATAASVIAAAAASSPARSPARGPALAALAPLPLPPLLEPEASAAAQPAVHGSMSALRSGGGGLVPSDDSSSCESSSSDEED